MRSDVDGCPGPKAVGVAQLQDDPTRTTQPSAMQSAPVAIYRMLHRADSRNCRRGSAAGGPEAAGAFFPRQRSCKGDVWELVEPVACAAPNELRFLLIVGRKYRLCVAQPRAEASVRLSASVVLEGGAEEERQSQRPSPVPEPKLLQFDAEATRAARGQAAGEGAEKGAHGQRVDAAELRLLPDGLTDGGFGFLSSTQALRGVWYELRALYADTGEPVCPVRLLIGTRTKAAPTSGSPPAPAPARHVLLPYIATPPDTPSPPVPQGSPSISLPSPPLGALPALLLPAPLFALPPPPAHACPARGAKSGGPARTGTPKLGGSKAKRAAPRNAAARADEDVTTELVDPFSLLVIASKSVDATASKPDEARASEKAADGIRFMDVGIVGYLEFLFRKTKDLFAGSSTSAETPDGRRAPRRQRRSSEAIDGAEDLLQRIDRSLSERTVPLDLRSPAARTAGDELLRAAATRPPPPLCDTAEDRTGFEDSVAEAIAAVEQNPAASDVLDKAETLRRLLADGRILCSRYVNTHSGIREMRRAFLVLRVATRSVAAEQRIVRELVHAAASAILSRVPLPSPFLVEACERSWRLMDALLPACRGLVKDLAMVPWTEVLSLTHLAVQALELVKGAEPIAYATALFKHGFRLLQFTHLEEARSVFFAALAIIRQYGLGPSLLEARTLACLTSALNRSKLLEESAKFEGMIYWFEDAETPEERNAYRECLEVMLLCAALRSDPPRLSTLTSELHGISQPAQLELMGADAELLQFWSLFAVAFANLHLRRIMDAIRVYREAVNLIATHPHVAASPGADIIGGWESILRNFEPSAVASGLRVAVSIHRLVDWSGRTPILAHLLFLLGRNYASAGETGKALAALTEAATEYGRFGGLFPPDHPRLLAAQRAADACRRLLAPAGTAPQAAAAAKAERVH